nr:SCO family protein [Sinorhizobium meliloti]
MNALKFVRYAAWASIAVLAAVLATAAIVPRSTPQAPQPVTTGQALVGGPFQLETVDGKPFSNKDVEGKPYLVFFGFTNCPDVCPTTLFELTGCSRISDPPPTRSSRCSSPSTRRGTHPRCCEST